MQAYTDASVNNGWSTHSYILYNNGEVVLQDCIKDNIESTCKAERLSILMLLLECERKGVKGVTIHTDSLNIVNTLATKPNKCLNKEITRLLEATESSVEWVNRELNKNSDSLCRSMNRIIEAIDMKNEQVESAKYFYLSPERHIKGRYRQGSINKKSISIRERKAMKEYYDSFIAPDKRCSLNSILKWARSKKAVNNKCGRLNIIERYICRHHSVDDIQFNKHKEVFQDFRIDRIELTKTS